MTITARVHEDRIILPDDVEIAEGTEVQVILPETIQEGAGINPMEWMSEFVGVLNNLPADAAERHTERARGGKRHLD